MSLTELKILTALVIIIITCLAGWIPFKQQAKHKQVFDFPVGEALASGVFLGAGLIHMLGDASSDFIHLNINYPIAFLIAGAVFLFLLWLEHLGREIYEHEGLTSPHFVLLAWLMLAIHSFFAGAALGLSTTTSVLTVLFIAIIAHKWAASFAIAIQINKSVLSKQKKLFAFAAFALMTPLGIFLGNMAAHVSNTHPYWLPTFSAIAAGTFIYLGTLHGLRRAVMVEKCCNLRHFSFVILGFSLMALIAVWT